MTTPRLPNWFLLVSHLLPLLLCLYFFIVALYFPNTMWAYIAKDTAEGAGLVENLTVIFLIPGILSGLYAFLKYRSLMQPHWTAYWLLLWTLACIYFAGEEVSWGQWFFQWSTPESFTAINDQNETNLHNVSTWFDQKPRTLVEFWIVVTGLFFPISHFIRKKSLKLNWRYWTDPLPSIFSAGLFFMIVRLAGWIDYPPLQHTFGSSELRELCVALFLSLFLISFLVRLHQLNTRI